MMTMPRNLKKVSWIALALVIGTVATSQHTQAEELLLSGSIAAKTAASIKKVSSGYLNPTAGQPYPLTIFTRNDGRLAYRLSFSGDPSFFHGVTGDATFDRNGNVLATNSVAGWFGGTHGGLYGKIRGKFTIYVGN